MMINATKEQALAIASVGNTLVSAAAGSGKTAVLVERVLRLLTDKESPISADRLLVVTFTNAAAAEMRSRIEKSLNDYCAEHTEDVNLTLQKHRLRAAKICTIDSFCIELVRDNFERLGIVPDFKIGDKAVLDDIKYKVAADLIEKHIRDNVPYFELLLDIVGAEKDADNMKNFLVDIYNSAQHLAFPEECYDSLETYYSGGNFDENNVWAKYAFSVAEATLERLTNSLDVAKGFLENSEDVYLKYSQAFIEVLDMLTKLQVLATEKNWDKFYNALNSFALIKLPDKNKKVYEDEDVEWAKAFYKDIPKKLEGLKSLFYADWEYIDLQFKKLYPAVGLLTKILKELDRKIFEEYSKANIFDFHNIEHMALGLLCESKDGKIIVKTDIDEICNQFDAVMVDEYQDVNDLQDTLFNLLSQSGKNLFAVGDIKQSIYGFRGSNVQHFNDKKMASVPYTCDDESIQKRIVLSKNFRTRPQVCEFINYIFGKLMTEKTGIINYGDDESLSPAAKYPEIHQPSVEISMIETKGSEFSSFEAEAHYIARYIKDVIRSGKVIRLDNNTCREAKYSDFAILLRDMNTNGAAFAEILKNQGIPVGISTEKFTENKEVKLFLRFLTVIDNPTSDVDLLCVLLSPIFRWSAEELANIRAGNRYVNLFSSVVTAAGKGHKKSISLIEKLRQWRLLSTTQPIEHFIRFLLEDTGYLDMVTVLEDGVFKRANLLLLCDYAKKFALEGVTDVGAFAKKMLNSPPSIFKGAGMHSDNAVKLMSIHKSKGLQFPVCIVAGLASAFNTNHKKQSNLFSTDFGIGFRYFDEQLKAQQSTVSFEAISDRISRSTPEEELRLFYVALTRTQDRLHLVMSAKNTDKFIMDVYRDLLCCDFTIDRNYFTETTSFAEWLVSVLLLHPKGNHLLLPDRTIPTTQDSSDFTLKRINALELLEESAEMGVDDVCQPDFELVNTAYENFKFKYPYADILDIEAKTSVSKLANSAEALSYAFMNKPSFMCPDGVTASGRGTAVHKCMQFFDFDRADDPQGELDRLYEWQFITEEERDAVDISAFEKFFNDPVFKRIKKSAVVRREMRFLTEIDASSVAPDIDSEIHNEKVIVQGAVDLCWVEDDGVVLLDFKTDRVNDPEKLKNTYAEQLRIYAMACAKIFGLKVKEKIIYSFNLGQTITL